MQNNIKLGGNKMQVQKISNNNYNTGFGATLKINTDYRGMAKPVIEFLEKQFPKRTENVKGKLELRLAGYPRNNDTLVFKNDRGFVDSIEIDSQDIQDAKKTRETLLDSLVNCLNGFVIRENAQSRINSLKKDMIEISDKAYRESVTKFKESFSVQKSSLNRNDIAPKDSGLWIVANRIQ